VGTLPAATIDPKRAHREPACSTIGEESQILGGRPEGGWGFGGQTSGHLRRSSGHQGCAVTGQPGGTEGLLGGPRRAMILLVVFIVAAGVAIGLLAYVAFRHRDSAPTPQAQPAQVAPATSSAGPSLAPPETVIVSVPPPSTVTVSAPPPAPIAVPTRQSTWTGVVVGTCDEGGTCGLQQRTAPYNNAARLNPNDLKDGMTVSVLCQAPGDVRSNAGYGTSYFWYQLSNGAYVNSVYISVQSSGIPAC
jgi:serine/threonine protein kinase, bacterial